MPLDPITGLPLLNADIVDQIPLAAQFFPWHDMGAASEPSRGPYYPDDIFSTMAHVTGFMQDNPRQDQVVYTDGKHALLVSDVGGGSGGSGPVSAMYGDGVQYSVVTVANNTFYLHFDSSSIADMIVGYDITVILAATSAIASNLQMYLEGPPWPGNDRLTYLCNASFAPSDPVGTSRLYNTTLVPAIDIVKTYGEPLSSLMLQVGCVGSFQLAYSFRTAMFA
jgi:hypothetical protein